MSIIGCFLTTQSTFSFFGCRNLAKYLTVVNIKLVLLTSNRKKGYRSRTIPMESNDENIFYAPRLGAALQVEKENNRKITSSLY